MKQSIDHNSAASWVLKYLLHLLGIAAFYGLILYTTLRVWLPLFSGLISKVDYVFYTGDRQLAFLLALYALFCYAANNFMLKLYENGKALWLTYSILADFIVLILGLMLSMLYNNLTVKIRMAQVSDVYNIYILTVLLLGKELLAAKLLSVRTSAGSQSPGRRR